MQFIKFSCVTAYQQYNPPLITLLAIDIIAYLMGLNLPMFQIDYFLQKNIKHLYLTRFFFQIKPLVNQF
jgi:hypothetical protein